MKKWLIILFLLMSISVLGQSNSGRKYDFFKEEKTNIKLPFALRDPFLKKRTKNISNGKTKKTYGTSYTNRTQMASINLDEIRIVGIFLGQNRKALAKLIIGRAPDGSSKLSTEVYILKEGMRLGLNFAEIRAILPGGVVLVEKIKNVYDQVEVLETILPLHETN